MCYTVCVMREWLSGRASPCQGERREFESRLPLQKMGCKVSLHPIFLGDRKKCFRTNREMRSSKFEMNEDFRQTKCPVSAHR